MLQRYTKSFHAFSAKLTQEEAKKLSGISIYNKWVTGATRVALSWVGISIFPPKREPRRTLHFQFI